MSTIQALILGIVQGITEFLPVSSSGHLMIFQYLLGLEDLSQYLLFDLVCHIGTLTAIFVVFRKEIRDALKSLSTTASIAIGVIPLFPLLLVIKPIKAQFESLDHLGYFYLISAFLLTLGIFSKEKPENKDPHWTQYVWIGMFQALAVLPGISRSGATITAALILGWSLQGAVRYSFLLAIPTILGGFFYELIKHPSLGFSGIHLADYAMGFALSFVVGGAALFALKTLKSKKMLIPFAIYCFLVGIALIIRF